ncbi:hypothetical protein ACJJTC_018262 [Scirpophaga incertulas]
MDLNQYKIVISEDGEFYLHDGYLTCEDPEDRPRWNHLATVMLIDLWKRQRTRFENNIERNEIIWEEIVSAMREAGFLFTAGQCETRFKYLKKCYIECIDINRKSTELNPSEAGYVPSTAATVIARSPAAAGSLHQQHQLNNTNMLNPDQCAYVHVRVDWKKLLAAGQMKLEEKLISVSKPVPSAINK